MLLEQPISFSPPTAPSVVVIVSFLTPCLPPPFCGEMLGDGRRGLAMSQPDSPSFSPSLPLVRLWLACCTLGPAIDVCAVLATFSAAAGQALCWPPLPWPTLPVFLGLGTPDGDLSASLFFAFANGRSRFGGRSWLIDSEVRNVGAVDGRGADSTCASASDSACAFVCGGFGQCDCAMTELERAIGRFGRVIDDS